MLVACQGWAPLKTSATASPQRQMLVPLWRQVIEIGGVSDGMSVMEGGLGRQVN
jgi:hypothetical protein